MNQPHTLLWHDDPYQLTVISEEGDETIVDGFIFFHVFLEGKVLQQQRKDLLTHPP